MKSEVLSLPVTRFPSLKLMGHKIFDLIGSRISDVCPGYVNHQIFWKTNFQVLPIIVGVQEYIHEGVSLRDIISDIREVVSLTALDTQIRSYP